ncbi:hypothetical protein KP509_22G006700 [Ceratopteris richardii]|uniref:Uncharacterized protein n=1 Tax=Ceratopteris richardii TaxID=49495 RepID=A0A8T2S2E3_CERRI|nr:hypothetical protein KP509_22G006700 [Ceratopteris richardii]
MASFLRVFIASLTYIAINLPLSFCKPGFDFFYFVQQWPGSYCDLRNKCCYPVTGKPIADFSIHGLWPNYEDGSYPFNCKGSSYDPSLISDLEDDLQIYWDTLACPTGDGQAFWSHEWKKHGTCSGLDQRGYFESALNLRESIDLLSALQNLGIQADGGSYTLKAVQKALTQAIGHKPGVECNRDIYGNRQLYQVYICVDIDGSTLIDCPIYPSSSCSSDISFPSF